MHYIILEGCYEISKLSRQTSVYVNSVVADFFMVNKLFNEEKRPRL